MSVAGLPGATINTDTAQRRSYWTQDRQIEPARRNFELHHDCSAYIAFRELASGRHAVLSLTGMNWLAATAFPNANT